jgi:chemotaxis regulatin CheY-phosphate phosphatase CheZ
MSDEPRLPVPAPPAPISESDYEAIAEAVMETARGRWFLAEYARRNRHADTTAVLGAIQRLEGTLAAARTPAPEIERIRMDIREMAQAIAQTKAEIAAIKPEGGDGGRFEEASVELDAIVQATAAATGDILGAAETIQEIAWTLREQGTPDEVCDLIDAKATDIYTACSFQDITGQRTRKVIGVLRFLEQRIDSMMAIWGDAGVAAAPPPPASADQKDSLLNGPALPGEGLGQSDVDLMMDETLFADAGGAEARPVGDRGAEPAPVPPEPAGVALEARATAAAALATDDRPLSPSPRPARDAAAAGRLPSIEEIEKLSFVEKVALSS